MLIVRNESDAYIMITQNEHGHLAGIFAENWTRDFFYYPTKRPAVECAIREHDRAWIPIDSRPLWNDQKNVPCSFIDFPNEQKLAFYKKGIDEVAAMDPYAGLLCSYHYTRFVINDTSPSSLAFIEKEKKRKQLLLQKVKEFSDEAFQFHYDLLRFCDNLSLFICMNIPGVTGVSVHPWFREGLSAPKSFKLETHKKINIEWTATNSLSLSFPLFERTFRAVVKQKTLRKKDIQHFGLDEAYARAPETSFAFTIA
jgi:hypothetical protein